MIYHNYVVTLRMADMRKSFLFMDTIINKVDAKGRVSLPADYRENRELDKVVKTILDKIATERDLEVLKAKEDKKKLLK